MLAVEGYFLDRIHRIYRMRRGILFILQMLDVEGYFLDRIHRIYRMKRKILFIL